MSSAREVVARALTDQPGSLKRADKVIAALEAAGFKLLQREPTDPMMLAAMERDIQFRSLGLASCPNGEIWEAMWDAASPAPSDGGTGC